MQNVAVSIPKIIIAFATTQKQEREEYTSNRGAFRQNKSYVGRISGKGFWDGNTYR